MRGRMLTFHFYYFGINFESRLTRKKANQAKKCAHYKFEINLHIPIFHYGVYNSKIVF